MKTMSKKIFTFIVIFVLFILYYDCKSQDFTPIKTEKGYRVGYTILDGDTIPIITLKQVVISTEMIFSNKRKKEQWTRLNYNLKVVYPLARVASYKIYQYNLELAKLKTEREKKEYINKAEKELKIEFEKHIRQLSFNQGVLLIKLIDRQTGRTSYEIVKEFKGGLNAFMWQGVARIFGNNLKTQYDPEGDDKLIEIAINNYESNY